MIQAYERLIEYVIIFNNDELFTAFLQELFATRKELITKDPKRIATFIFNVETSDYVECKFTLTNQEAVTLVTELAAKYTKEYNLDSERQVNQRYT